MMMMDVTHLLTMPHAAGKNISRNDMQIFGIAKLVKGLNWDSYFWKQVEEISRHLLTMTNHGPV